MRPQETTRSIGRLVTFEGIDRAGKTSVIRVLPDLLADCRVPITTCGERRSPLARFLSAQAVASTSAFLKTYLFAADRAWTYEKACLPALRRGGLVLWDRYVDSALVYRAVEFSLCESEIDMDFVELINSRFMPPDLTFYIDITASTSVARAESAGSQEAYDAHFMRLVRAQYLALAETRDYVVVDGERPLDEVAACVAGVIRQRLGGMFS